MSLSQEQISDRIEIHDLLTRYTVAIDTKDWKLLDRCFMPDAELDYTSAGGIKGSYPEVRKWLEMALAPFPRWSTMRLSSRRGRPSCRAACFDTCAHEVPWNP